MSKELRIAIAGLGTVGSSVLRLLQKSQKKLCTSEGEGIKIVAVSARNKARANALNLEGIKWFDDAVVLAGQEDIDVFVELIGGSEGVAKESIITALNAGHHVVTANKALLADSFTSLISLAKKNNALLKFEAAVAGGVPIVKVMRECLSANHISKIFGILNGTCNFILTRMIEQNRSFVQCLEDAQKLGYAEADPSFDILGIDTAHKLALLTSFAFGTKAWLKDIYIEGIENVSLEDIKAAQSLGYKIKLLAVAIKGEKGVEQRVHPSLIRESSALAQVEAVTNAVSIRTDLLSELFLSGPGAGGDATASAVIADLMDIARLHNKNSSLVHIASEHEGEAVPVLAMRDGIKNHKGSYFVRLVVEDRPGVFASIATHMAKEEISLESIVQTPLESNNDISAKTVVLITHDTVESAITSALHNIESCGYLLAAPKMIRIEDI